MSFSHLNKWLDLFGLALIDIPHTYEAVIRSGHEHPLFFVTPCEPVPLAFMSDQSQLWRFDLCSHLRLRRVFEVVIYVHLAADSLSRYYIVTLWHLPRFIHFTGVINRDIHPELLFLLTTNVLSEGILCYWHLD